MHAVVVLMAGEAAVEGERGLGLGRIPGGVAHAVAPRVEMRLLHNGLVFVHHLLPAAEMVGEDVIEVSRTVFGDMHGHDAPLGIDVIEPAGGGGSGFHLIKVRNPGLFLDERLPVGDHRVPPHIGGVIIERDVVTVLIQSHRPVAQIVGDVALRCGDGGSAVTLDGGDGMGFDIVVAVVAHFRIGGDVAGIAVGEGSLRDAIYLVGGEVSFHGL